MYHDILTFQEMLERPYEMVETQEDAIFMLCDYSVISGDYSLVGY